MKNPLPAKIGWRSATAVVIANMIGTGAFTTLGFQLETTQNTWSILLLWSLGGVIAILGSFSYAELGTHYPKSGGDYHFLRETMHPFLGYLSGWVSMTVGFAAPIALAAMAMGAYLSRFVGISANWIAVIAILLISVLHSGNLRKSSRFQDIFTLLKVLLIVGLVVVGLWPSEHSVLPPSDYKWREELVRPSFAVSLVYVTYAFSGWNAAAYIVGEIRNPRRNLPIALIGGTVLVSVLYVLLQLVFLRQAPLEAMVSKVEVGQIVAEYMFGSEAARWVSVVIALLLVSSISAMIWVGPRISRAMSVDYRLWSFLRHDNRQGIPVRAVWFQSGISLLLILTGTFEEVLLYSGFVLHLFTTITVASVFIARRKRKGQAFYRSPLYPVPQLLFILISVWMLGFLLIDQARESLIGFANLGLGALTWWWSERWMGKKSAFALLRFSRFSKSGKSNTSKDEIV